MKRKVMGLILLILLALITAGCWNYKEIEQLAIVAGVAVDRADDNSVLVTVEIINVNGEEKNTSISPEYIQYKSDSLFSAVREMIAIEGKKLYWSHAKVAIFSEEIAENDITRVLDFMNRDAEVREDMWILLSKERTAAEIFLKSNQKDKIISRKLDDILKAHKNVTKYCSVELYDFLNCLGSDISAAVMPTIELVEQNKDIVPEIKGEAVFHKGRLIGYLDENETQAFLWVRNKLNLGLFVVEDVENRNTRIALEISKSKTKLKPYVEDGELVYEINIEIDAGIGEITGYFDFTKAEELKELQKMAENQMRKKIEKLIIKAKEDFELDFLGFGNTIKQKLPNVWREVENDWGNVFKQLKTKVEVKVDIKGSATTKSFIKIGK